MIKIQHMASGAVAAFAVAAALGFASHNAQPSPLAAPQTPPAQAPGQPPAPSAGQTFNIDTVHSSVVFGVQHSGLAKFYGVFKDVSGSFALGDAPSLNVIIKTASVDTRNEGRDRHLKSPDFFNAAEFPEITFKSTKIEKSGDMLKITGDFTMHGVTKPVTAEIKPGPVKQGRQGSKSGFDTTFTIKRSDFGMTASIADGGMGDEVTIMFGAEGSSK